MPEDRGLGSIALAMARQAARQARLAEEAQRRATREASQGEAERFRAEIRAEREALAAGLASDGLHHDRLRRRRELYVRERQSEAAEQSDGLRNRWHELERVLSDSLLASQRVYLDDLRLLGEPSAEPPPDELLHPIERPPGDVAPREERGRGLAALMPLGRHTAGVVERDDERPARHSAISDWAERERRRLESLIAWEVEQEAARENFLTKQLWRNREIEAIGRTISAGDGDAIATYIALTLERAIYPEGIERRFEITFDRASGRLLVDVELPRLEIVPAETDVQYVQSGDRISPIPIRPVDRRLFHQNLNAAIALRTLHEIAIDLDGLPVTSIGLNGFVPTTSGDGRAVTTCQISLIAKPRDIDACLTQLAGATADPRAALRGLGAVLPRSTDIPPSVEPLFAGPSGGGQFVAFREPGLADIRAALAALGLEGIRDVPGHPLTLLAFDEHPVLGGKVLCTGLATPERAGADTVASCLADMAATGAVRGLLITAGDFDLAALELASTRPVELIDGAGWRLLQRRLRGQA